MSNENNYIGKIYHNRYGDLIVSGNMKLGIFDQKYPNQPREKYVEAIFLNNGNKIYTSLSNLRHHNVKNPYLPSVCGIGKLGDLPYGLNLSEGLEGAIYQTWLDILKRCTGRNSGKGYRYNEYGISVSEPWTWYSVFREDVKSLPGYIFKVNDISNYQLDKDYLCRKYNIPLNRRIYSKETCIWVSRTDNCMIDGAENKATKLYGVRRKDNGYYCVIEDRAYGKFNESYAAGNLFNYIYPLIMAKDPYNRHIRFINDKIPYISFYDLCKYQIGNIDYIKSVQRLEQEVGMCVDVSVPGIIPWSE